MPSLVYVLGISGAVHVVNYYRESVAEHGMETAPDNAVKLGFWPCTMAALTTSLGLLSLATSNIVPIRKFGCYAAVGVIATLVLLFTYLPAALEMWPPRRYLKRTSSKADTVTHASALERFLDRFWQGVGHFVIDHYRLVQVTCFLLLVLGLAGLTKINTSVQLLKLFDAKAKIIEDYQWLEANLGKLVPMELVVCVNRAVIDPSTVNVGLEEAVNDAENVFAEPRPEGMSFLERMEISRSVAEELDSLYGEPGMGKMSRPMSANTFAPEKDQGFWAERRRNIWSDGLEASRQEFIDADFLRVDPEDKTEFWRISLRLAALDDIDFGRFVQNVQCVVEPIMLAYEYRENILRRVPLENRPRVFFVANEGTFEQPKADPIAPEILANMDQDEIPVDQSLIFWKHLRRLLKTEGMSPKGIITKAAQLKKYVKSTDVVIVLNNADDITSTGLNATGCFWLDARSHEFDPETEATATARKRGQNVSVVYTGLVPIVYKAQTTLLTSLIRSTGLAFVMIAVVMILLLRSPKAGLLAMLPNVFPVVIIFGVMGWCNKLVDIGSMMTASVAMGVAVDDTIHFLSWFRRGLDEGHSRKEAILLAYRRVATAMTQTTAIGGIGLSIFAFSTFTPTQMFGTLMLALLAAALVGDLLFLPALLASPLGKMFDRNDDKQKKNEVLAPRANVEGPTHRPASLPSTHRQDAGHRSNN